jgi:hypothetical protein
LRQAVVAAEAVALKRRISGYPSDIDATVALGIAENLKRLSQAGLADLIGASPQLTQTYSSSTVSTTGELHLMHLIFAARDGFA